MAGVQTFLAFAETVKRGSFAEAARELGTLSDRELRDIGLCRAEIEQVAARCPSSRS